MNYSSIITAISATTKLDFLVFDSTLNCLEKSDTSTALLMKTVVHSLDIFLQHSKQAMISKTYYGTIIIFADSHDQYLVIIYPYDLKSSAPQDFTLTLQLIYALICEKPLSEEAIVFYNQETITFDDLTKKTHQDLMRIRLHNHNQDYLNEVLTLSYVRTARFDKIKEAFIKMRASNTESIVKDNTLDTTIKTICMCTLLARIAIEEHVPVAHAFSLSDVLIRTALAQTTKDDAASHFEATLLYFTQLIEKHKYQNDSIHVQKVVHYINAHLYEGITLKAIASDLNYSTWYLSRIFKQTTGLSINEMIHSLKISEAKIFLRFTDYSSQNIATQLGYTHHSHFIERFKRLEKCTPDHYRKQIGLHDFTHISEFIWTL